LSGHAHAKAADSAEVKKLASLLERADALVIGPGLGRDKRVMDVAAEAIRMAGAMGLPTVIDGDALYLVSQQPDVVKGHTAAILTPNPVEFQRLVDAVTGKGGSGASASASSAKSQPRQAGDKRDHAAASSDGNASGTPQDDEEADAAAALSRALGGVAILRKGSRDIAVASTGAGAAEAEVAIVVGGGSPRRCGGQGDVLAGTLGTMLAWARRAGAFPSKSKGSGEHNSTSSSSLSSSSTSPHRLSPREALVACGYGAALLTRRAAAMAFSKHHRAMTTPDLIAELGGAFEDVFPDTLYQGGAADD
jgi:ATP-dependent NAD(P)H-hydrate dehydratase